MNKRRECPGKRAVWMLLPAMLGCLAIGLPTQARAQATDTSFDWLRGVYAESDSATAAGRGQWLLQLYATRGYRCIGQNGKFEGVEQSLADWMSLQQRLPYGTELRAITTIDTIRYAQTAAMAVVRGSKHFEMTYYDLLSGGIETERSDAAFEDLWVRQGAQWRLQSDEGLPPAMQLARVP